MYKVLPSTSGALFVLGMSGHQAIALVLFVLVSTIMVRQMVVFKVNDKRING